MIRPQPGEQIVMLPIDQISRHPKARAINDEALKHLSDSIELVGLLTPIRVAPATDQHCDVVTDQYVVVAGHHRFAACDLLGHREVPCLITYGDDLDNEMVMIAENLHRAELTTLDRDEQVARWIELCGLREAAASAQEVSAQIAPKPIGGRPESGINAASRDLGIERTDAQRAVRIAGLSDEAKAVARETGLDDNRTALLNAARQTTPEAQAQALRDRAESPAVGPRRQGGVDGPHASVPQTGLESPLTYDDLTRLLDQLGPLRAADYLRICPAPRRPAMCQRLSQLADVFHLVMEGVTT